MLSSRAFLIGFVLTFLPFCDVPVFWPILLLYWLVLVAFTLNRQIRHMIKFKYLPFDLGGKAVRCGPLRVLRAHCLLRFTGQQRTAPARTMPLPPLLSTDCVVRAARTTQSQLRVTCSGARCLC